MSDIIAITEVDREQVLLPVVREQPHPLIFVTISGAHLYGFPSPDSDFDLRGVHILPLRAMLALAEPLETVEASGVCEGREIDLVTHDVRKFARLLLKPNGYVLEQVLSPLVVLTTPAHEELATLAHGCITRVHSKHYQGFAESQWRLFMKEEPHRVKPLLYVFRVLLTGIHLMRTGTVEADLNMLNEAFGLPYLEELIEQKRQSTEQTTLNEGDLAFFEGEFARLLGVLEEAMRESTLPEAPSARPALEDYLIRTRLAYQAADEPSIQ
jgi:predicted nucleotidyltransferase